MLKLRNTNKQSSVSIPLSYSTSTKKKQGKHSHFRNRETELFLTTMASLTPGVLSKLLQNSTSTNSHRQPLLQVTEIIPRLSEDTFQPATGYFLKLSDSLHSAYVSVSDSDAELIRSDKLQLGQFVYVTRFDNDASSSVPRVSGLKTISKRRACVGNPVDLVSTDSLRLAALKLNGNVKKKKKINGSDSNGNKDNNVVVNVEMRRLSLDSSTRRVWDHASLVSKTKSSSSPSSRFTFSKSASTSPNVFSSLFYIFLHLGSLKMKVFFFNLIK